MHFYVIYLNVRRDNITLELEELSWIWVGWIGCALALWLKGYEFKPC